MTSRAQKETRIDSGFLAMQLEIGEPLVQKKLPDGGEEKAIDGPCLPEAGDEHLMQSQRSLNTAPGFLTQTGGDYIRDSGCVKALCGISTDTGMDRPAGSLRYSRQDAGATLGGELRCGGQLSCFRRAVLEALGWLRAGNRIAVPSWSADLTRTGFEGCLIWRGQGRISPPEHRVKRGPHCGRNSSLSPVF